MAGGKATSVEDAAQVIHRWLERGVSVSSLHREFGFVKPTDKAAAVEEGRLVEWSWTRAGEICRELQPYVEVARKHAIVSQLFCYTSHEWLGLSLCTGYPFEVVGHLVRENPHERGQFQVADYRLRIIGSGSATHALKLVVESLPPNVGAARSGTAVDEGGPGAPRL